MDIDDPGDVGLQFTISFADQYSVPDLVDLAARAERHGFSKIWVNDNLGYRNVFTVLSAIASDVSVGLGTAVAVPYYRNPVDLADTIGAITELAPGRELSIGLGRGSLAQTGIEIETPAPYHVLAETASMVERLLEGERVRFGDFEHLTEVFDLRPDARMHLRFAPQAPVRFYIGGYGPTALKVGGQAMHGVLFGGWFLPLLRAGRIEELKERTRRAARAVDEAKDLRFIAELNVAIAEDPQDALEFGKLYGSHAMITLRNRLADEDFEAMGVDPDNLERLERAFEAGATIQEAADLVTEPMVKALFIAGDAEMCAAQLRDLQGAHDLAVDEVSFAKLGPEYETAVDALAEDVIPRL